MRNASHLQRFIEAQETTYAAALAEIKNGKKRSHWMWFIFPQIQGLGFSSTSQYYALKDAREATAYVQHAVLGNRLIQLAQELLALKSSDATSIFGNPDDLKLRSSLTLFASLPGANPIFQAVLVKFFNGLPDPQTLRILHQQA